MSDTTNLNDFKLKKTRAKIAENLRRHGLIEATCGTCNFYLDRGRRRGRCFRAGAIVVVNDRSCEHYKAKEENR